MARSVVELLIAAKDATGAAFRSARANLRGFMGDASKFAAGLGIFDSFKQLGRFLFQAAREAARAVPELAAPFDAVQQRWEKLRLEIGAGALQLGVPIANFAIDVLDKFKGLTQAISEEWFKLPARWEEVLGLLEQKTGAFIAGLETGMRVLGGASTNIGIGLMARGADRSARGRQERENLEAEFALPDTAGPSAVERALATKAAREAEERQAKREQLLARIAASGQATQGELDQLVAADAALARQLEATNLTLERRAQLLERQRGVRGALQGVSDRLAGAAPAPRVVTRGGEQDANRLAEIERLAAAERSLRAEIDAGGQSTERRVVLEEELHRTEQARLALQERTEGILARRDLGASDRGAAQLALEAEQRRQRSLADLRSEEEGLKAVVTDGTRAIEERAIAEERLLGIQRERAALTAQAGASETLDPVQMGEDPVVAPPRSTDPLAIENLLSPEDRALIPEGAGAAAVEEIGMVREALGALGTDLLTMSEQGWQRFGNAAANAAEQAFEAEQHIGKAIVGAGRAALGTLARTKAKNAFIHAGEALAAGLMGQPAAFVAAAKYTAAGTAWSALAGELGSGGGGGGGSGGGGGGGGGTPFGDQVGSGVAGRLGGTLVIRGVPQGAIIDGRHPDYLHQLNVGLEELGLRNVRIEVE